MSLPGPVATPVVFDVNVLVQAIASGNSPYLSWPSPPPTSGNPFADCLGIVNDAAEFALWLSPHVLDNTTRVLMAVVGTPTTEADDYRAILTEMAEASGGGVVLPPRTVHDCPDHEDNLVLDLVADVGALLVVSEDTDLTAMSPWRGVPILRAREFAGRVDAMRRHRR
ncbi:PIN domain-containing protein [Asanoa sp. WMMD1127]|uniref:PIN domain-containing protein n=1 Tax=Asanoa sp. WMMD1127 TaxID=3016107 RepID=UPI002415D8BF|nr:PIN domain-containing protein [Asanoa sp. WMMD1127]MDG4823804.1 PIN domain-containing protein [Asanoa sp. WMMD1127]